MMSLFEIHAVVATQRVHEREFQFFHSSIAHYIYITYIIILYCIDFRGAGNSTPTTSQSLTTN